MIDFIGYARWVVTPLCVTRSGEFHWQAKRLAVGQRAENRIIAVFVDNERGRANAEQLAAETTERF